MSTRSLVNVAKGLALAFLAASWSAPPALAQPGPDAGPHGRWWANPRVAEKLSLTPQQVEEIDEIAFAMGERMIDLRAEHEKAQLELQRLLARDDVDRAAVERALTRLEEAKCSITSLEARSRIEIALRLDRDQRERVMQRFEQRARDRHSFERDRRRRMLEEKRER